MTQEAELISEVLNITHALTGIGGAGTTAIIAGLIYRFTKKDLQEGLVTNDDLKEHLDEINKELEDLKSMNKDRIHNERDLYEKTNTLGQRISTIEGQLSK